MGSVSFVTDSIRGELPLNWYPIKDDQRGLVLRRTPGLDGVKTIDQDEAVERRILGFATTETLIFIAVGCDAFANTVIPWVGEAPANCLIIKGDTTFAAAGCWALNIDTSSTALQIEVNATDICVCDGTSLWAIKIATPFTVTKQAFEASSLVQADGYMIASVKGTGQFRISSLNDAFTWDPLDYGTAEGDMDSLQKILISHREIWAYGAETTEIYYNSGAADFPYARASGGFLQYGIGASASAALCDNMPHWLSDKRQVLRAQQYQPQIISTRKLDRILAGFTTVSDAVGWGQVFNGHAFYWLVFPTEKRTFVFDSSTEVWHERSTYDDTEGEHDAYLARCYAYFNGKHYVGGLANPIIYEMSDSYRDDDGVLIRRRVDSAEIQDTQSRRLLSHAELEIEFEQGETNATDIGHMLEWSDDGGNTWSNQRIVEAGDIGGYADQVVFRRLGKSKARIYRYTTAHGGVDTILGATLRYGGQ